MRLNTVFTVSVVLVSMFALAGCDKVAAIAGGPADGHDVQWYQAHYADATAEAVYCTNKYHGPNSTQEDLAKMPNFCKDALSVTTAHINALRSWATWEAKCKTAPNNPYADASANAATHRNDCSFAVRAAEGLDTSSKDAQDILAQAIKKLASE